MWKLETAHGSLAESQAGTQGRRGGLWESQLHAPGAPRCGREFRPCRRTRTTKIANPGSRTGSPGFANPVRRFGHAISVSDTLLACPGRRTGFVNPVRRVREPGFAIFLVRVRRRGRNSLPHRRRATGTPRVGCDPLSWCFGFRPIALKGRGWCGACERQKKAAARLRAGLRGGRGPDSEGQ